MSRDTYISPLEKMLPTRVIRWLFLVIIGTPAMAIYVSEILPLGIILQSFQKSQLEIFALWVLLVCLVLALIILDYALFVKNKFKHAVVVQTRDAHELMSIKWLIENLKNYHWILICLICMLFFYAGMLFASNT